MNKPEQNQAAGPLDYLKALPQHLVPGHFLSSLMHRLARCQTPWIKDLVIQQVIKRFQVDMSLAAEENPTAYPSFNAFFTRSLKPEARPIAAGDERVVSPVDGGVSQAGIIGENARPGALPTGKIFQAKGKHFTLDELLGNSREHSAPFVGGHYSTLYLSPRDYHRIHCPMDATLREMIHIPGKLFSVSPATTRAVQGLFARNERVVAIFDTAAGPMAMVMVGAIFVSSIETVWAGEVTPPTHREVRTWKYDDQQISFKKGEEIGRFNMGSTVILLFGPNKVEWASSLQPQSNVQVGQCIAQLTEKAPTPSPDQAPAS